MAAQKPPSSAGAALPPYAPPPGPVRIVCSGAGWLVAEKPPGLLSVPGRGPEKADCLVARLEHLVAGVRIVHRLDMETSGLMVFARNAEFQAALSRAFAQRRVHKRYEALVWGEVCGESGTIDLPLIADWPNRPLQKVCRETGKPSLTHWRVLSRSDGLTRLSLRPRTGRSHQLRVHLHALGHPIIGDRLYGPGAQPASHRRMCLHATHLCIDLPGESETIRADSPAPF